MDNGKATLFAKGTGLRALLERNGYEFFDYDEELLKDPKYKGMTMREVFDLLSKEQTNG